jgi:hypothetical protein
MRRLRFTIAQLIAIVIVIGFGFAALRNANAVWASATFSLAILTVSVALAGACSQKMRARMPWLGFGTAGGLYLVIWLWTSSTIGHVNGPPNHFLYTLQPQINPQASGGPSLIYYSQISHALEVMTISTSTGRWLSRSTAGQRSRPLSVCLVRL